MSTERTNTLWILKIRFFNITYYHKDIFTHFTEIENKNTKLRMKRKIK